MEDTLIVPAEVVNSSVGFSVDAGGTNTKVLYRSKLDYNGGQCLKNDIPVNKGILRKATFRSCDTDIIIDYIAENCDFNNEYDTSFSTGVNTNSLAKKLKEKFDIRLCRFDEFDTFIVGFRFLMTNFSMQSLVHDPHPKGLQQGEEYLKPFLACNEVREKRSNCGFGSRSEVIIQEDGSEDIVPCLLTLMGSTCFYFKVGTDWTADLVDMNHLGGRSFLGVTNAICGENKSYSEVMNLSEVGRTASVDVSGEQLEDIEPERKNSDVYSGITNNLVVFAYGHLSFSDPIGTDWTADLVDMNHLGGRSFLGVTNAICGEKKSYSEVMNLSEVGRTASVDVSGEQLEDIEPERKNSDVYSGITNNLVVFAYGHLSFSDPSMFSLEDKVAGWLNMVCAHYAESTHRVAMNHGVNRVFIAGGFCKHQIVQVYITKFWAMRNALFGQGKDVKLYFMKNGEYIGALGAYVTDKN